MQFHSPWFTNLLTYLLTIHLRYREMEGSLLLVHSPNALQKPGGKPGQDEVRSQKHNTGLLRGWESLSYLKQHHLLLPRVWLGRKLESEARTSNWIQLLQSGTPSYSNVGLNACAPFHILALVEYSSDNKISLTLSIPLCSKNQQAVASKFHFFPSPSKNSRCCVSGPN